METDTDLSGFSLLFGIAQFLGVFLVILVISWLEYFRGGFSWNSNIKFQFNWHPLLMIVSMVFLYANGIMMFRGLRTRRKSYLKLFHSGCHISVFIIAVIGLQAVFDSHNLANPPYPNMRTLHSWVGLTAIVLFACQFVIGLLTYLWPGVKSNIRAAYMPVHRFFGMTGFVFSIAASLMGLLEDAHWEIKDYENLESEGLLVNLIGVIMMIFGTLVIYIVTTDTYKRVALTEDMVLLAMKD